MSAPPTRLISWQQVVTEADPDWLRGMTRPWVYSFSNGRKFSQEWPLYTAYDIFGLASDAEYLASSILPASAAPVDSAPSYSWDDMIWDSPSLRWPA